MLNIREYVKVQSLEEAYELNQKRTNKVIGGMLWMKMGSRNIQKAIDLSGLGLDKIEETEEEFRIGCMTTLRDLELHPGLEAYTGGAMKESLRHIVGVQFRNLATVGGSIFGRFGFSDVLTLFLGLDTDVELYKGGIVPLSEFAWSKRDNDILVGLIVKKRPVQIVYQSLRLSGRISRCWRAPWSVLTENGELSSGQDLSGPCLLRTRRTFSGAALPRKTFGNLQPM